MTQHANNTYSILTASGIYFDLADPKPDMVRIDDIAQALSKLCRYTGHCEKFYSVAQHSVLVSMEVPPEHALAALLHDAHEAYTGDMNRPLKNLIRQNTQAHDVVTRSIDFAIHRHFGLDLKYITEGEWENTVIKHADSRLLMTEKRDIMHHDDTVWTAEVDGCEYRSDDVKCWIADKIIPGGPVWSFWAFMMRYWELVGDAEAMAGAQGQIEKLRK